ncbi:MAG TPA: c-type cytochrome [Anaerolineaceae bacterium]|nr:c-type cytochrome [Anaerolineaceae bacterium]
MKHIKFILLLMGVSLALAGCIPLFQSSSISKIDDTPNTENGEQIYFTSTSQRGGRIRFSGGPSLGGMMMGSYLTCASCHGPTGQGGRHTMHMTTMDAPDIRYEELAHEMEEHGGEGEYDLATFRKAVVDGEHPDGDSLDRDMPRWRMSEADLADLFAFLQSLE